MTRHSARAPSRAAWSRRARRLVEAFIAACEGADPPAVASLMRRDAALTIDSGGSVAGVSRADAPAPIAAAIIDLLRQYPGFDMKPGHINGRPGIVINCEGRVVGVINAVRRGRRVHEMWIVVNAEKLHHWNPM